MTTSHDSPLRLFEMLSSFADVSEQVIKQASANGAFCSSCGVAPVIPGEELCGSCSITKTASQKKKASKKEPNFLKLAGLCEQFAQHLEKLGEGIAQGQPVSNVGPADNEVISVPKADYKPQEAKTNQVGEKRPEEAGGRVATNEDKHYPISEFKIKAAAQELRARVKQAAGVPVSDREILSLFIMKKAEEAAGQPVSKVGPADNETKVVTTQPAGAELTRTRPEEHMKAQDADRHAKKDLPLQEPTAKEPNVESQKKAASSARAKLAAIAAAGCTCGGKGICSHCKLSSLMKSAADEHEETEKEETEEEKRKKEHEEHEEGETEKEEEDEEEKEGQLDLSSDALSSLM